MTIDVTMSHGGFELASFAREAKLLPLYQQHVQHSDTTENSFDCKLDFRGRII